MKKSLLLLSIILTFVFQASGKEIMAKIVFENRTNQELKSGKFFIADLNKVIEINSENNFEIILPERGKYRFSFYTEDFDTYTYYPAKITHKRNIITIRLQEKGKNFNYLSKEFNQLNEVSGLLPGNFKFRKTEEYGMNFIIHSINPEPVNYNDFEKKYGIGIVFKNCLIDPLSFRKAVEHNKYIFKYLNERFDTDKWIEDLPIKPFGLK